MDKPTFHYVTNVCATPATLLQALTEPDINHLYWLGMHRQYDWTRGSAWKLVMADCRLANIGAVIEIDPPRRLSYTLRSMRELYNGSEKPSRVVFGLEGPKDQVKLTVVHNDFVRGSKVSGSISRGWPLVLSNLKSYLETGATPLYTPWYEKQAVAAS